MKAKKPKTKIIYKEKKKLCDVSGCKEIAEYHKCYQHYKDTKHKLEYYMN